MKGLNLKEACKQIKYYGNRNLIWSRQSGFHYITNRHWMLRFPEDQMPREILVTLFAIFAEIPKDGRALNIFAKNQSEVPAVDVKSIYSRFPETTEGKATAFIKDIGHLKMRVLSCNSDFIFINEDYSRMVDMSEHNPRCKGSLNPIFFIDGALIILPYRFSGDADDKGVLDSLLPDENGEHE